MALLTNPLLADPRLLHLAGLRVKQRTQGTASVVIPTTDDALWQYVYDVWEVAIPRLQVCPHHVAPFQLFAYAFFGRGSMFVLKGSRGLAGKSFLLSVLAATFAVLQGANVVILGGSQQQSKNVHDYMQTLWHRPHTPRHLLAGEPLVTETRLTTGNKIVALPASQASVRGPHPEKLLFDEVDEADLAIVDAAMGQTMARNAIPACTVLSSTHHYQQGPFSEVLRRAKERSWPIAEMCYRETLEPHGWLAPGEVDRKRNEMTAQQWQVEVELQEPSGEARAIDPAAVAACFRRELGEWEGREREYVEAEVPVTGYKYAHGADWAKSVDFTEIVSLTADGPPYRVVAYERMRRLPWPQMVGRFDARMQRYTGAAAHDGTGLGDVVDGYLTTAAENFKMVGRARADLFSDCVNALEKGEIVSPWITSLEGQVHYCTVDDLYGAGHPPDGFVALALAYRAAKYTPPAAKRAGTWGR